MLIRAFLCLTLVTLARSQAEDEINVNSHNKVVACYVAGWSAYRPDAGAFTVEKIDPMLCTHIIYAFAGLNNETNTIQSLDSFLDTEEGGGRAQYKKVIGLKQQNPKLKVTIAIGGWNEGSEKYSNMANSNVTRRAFIDSVLAFITKHGFDGLDMDWEYPGSRTGSRVQDRENFALLLQELRTEFDKKGLILTAAVGAAQATINRAYDVPAINKALDFIHIMAYDYHGSWDGQIGHNAPLNLPIASSDLAPELRLSVADTVEYFFKLGASREKLVVGIPFYGRTFTLVDPSLNKIGAASNGTGFQGPYTREDGFLGYNEICKEIEIGKQDLKNRWFQDWDNVAQVPYMSKDDRWVSYDNERSVEIKAELVYRGGLAGVMVWAIDNDDFVPECSKVRYPLLRSINTLFKVANDNNYRPDDGPTTTSKPTGPTGKASSIYGNSFNIICLVTSLVVVLQFSQ